MNEMDRIVNEIAETFQIMKWEWDTEKFKGIPTRELIRKNIIEKIQELQDAPNQSSVASGRINVIKSIEDSDYDGEVVTYEIMLNHYTLSEDTLQLEGNS